MFGKRAIGFGFGERAGAGEHSLRGKQGAGRLRVPLSAMVLRLGPSIGLLFFHGLVPLGLNRVR